MQPQDPSAAALTDDNIPPLPENATPEQKDAHWFKYVYQGDRMPQLTIRAVLMGGILGMLMSASNLYTTLTVGWAFGVAITSCIMSFVVWNIFRFLSGTVLTLIFIILAQFGLLASFCIFAAMGKLSWTAAAIWMAVGTVAFLSLFVLLRRRLSDMSLLENNCMQSTASAAGYSTGSTIATMFGALLLMQSGDSLNIKTWAVQPIWLVGAFTFLTGCMGVFLAIPMKRQMINHEQLPFPSGIAAATTLKSLYSKSREAVHKAYALVVGLLVGGLVGILNTQADTLAFLDKAQDGIKKALGFSMRLPELVPEEGFTHINGKQLIGYGFEPSVLLIAAGMIVGMRVSLSMLVGSILLYVFVAPWLIHMDAANTDPTHIASMDIVANGTIYHVYRWGLWGGTALMVFASLTALALQWKTVARSFTMFKQASEAPSAAQESPDLAALEVPTSWMIAGMLPITIGMIILQIVAFNISWYAGLIAVAMSFVLSFVACRATGETDTTPIGAMGKVMQLTFAVLHPGKIIPNLAAAGIAANSASSSADLLTDLKSGYLLGANPRKQFLAQFMGIFFGIVAIVPIWYLMVPTKAALEKFPAPATNQWFKVAQVLTKGIDTLPESAKWAIYIGACLGIAIPIIEKTLVPQKYRPYFPSAIGLGLSWMVPFANSLAFAIGALIQWVWNLISKRGCEVFNVPLASGLVAGESLIKAIIAMTATVIGLMHQNK